MLRKLNFGPKNFSKKSTPITFFVSRFPSVCKISEKTNIKLLRKSVTDTEIEKIS